MSLGEDRLLLLASMTPNELLEALAAEGVTPDKAHVSLVQDLGPQAVWSTGSSMGFHL